MPKILSIISILVVSLYTAVMGYSLGVVAETDASVASSLLRNVTRQSGGTATYATREWKTWQDGDYNPTNAVYDGYAVMYPRDFERATGDAAAGGYIGEPRVQLLFPDDAFAKPKTNFGSAFLTIRVSDEQNQVMRCYANPLESSEEDTLTEVVTVNGSSFHRGTLSEAAAGNRYDSHVYRALRGSRCYEVTLTVHTGNIDNYTPGTVAEFDKERAFRILEKMLGTFAFTDTDPNAPVSP